MYLKSKQNLLLAFFAHREKYVNACSCDFFLTFVSGYFCSFFFFFSGSSLLLASAGRLAGISFPDIYSMKRTEVKTSLFNFCYPGKTWVYLYRSFTNTVPRSETSDLDNRLKEGLPSLEQSQVEHSPEIKAEKCKEKQSSTPPDKASRLLAPQPPRLH